MAIIARSRSDVHFPMESAGLLRRAGLVTATALLAIAIALAASASFEPSLGREPAPSPAIATDVV